MSMFNNKDQAFLANLLKIAKEKKGVQTNQTTPAAGAPMALSTIMEGAFPQQGTPMSPIAPNLLAAVLGGTASIDPQPSSPPVADLLSGFDAQAEVNSSLQETIGQVGTDVQADATASIDSNLLQAIQAPETQSGFMSMFKSPEFKELLLQTGLRMAQGQNFGEALGGGALAARETRAGMEKATLDSQLALSENDRRNRETAVKEGELTLDQQLAQQDNAKSIAETGKLNAETTRLLKELTQDGKVPITESQYTKMYSDMLLGIKENAFLTEENGFLDPETESRYLINSTLPPSSRRYGMLKDVYATELSSLVGQVESGAVTQDVLESRIDEYEVAFGSEQTNALLRQLRGN